MISNSKTYSPLTFSFWKAYFVQMRPYLLFVSGVSGWAGMSLAFHSSINLKTYILTFIPVFFGYGFGQALTDCFQIDTDSISAPYRPLSRGDISVNSVLATSISGLIIISLILIYLNYWNILLCLLSIVGLASYSKIKKKYWYGGPIWNSLIVAILPIMGYISVMGDNSLSIGTPTIQKLIALSFFSYASFVLIGYLKDINADRKTGYRTFPVVFGWTSTVWINYFFIIFSVCFCFMLVSISTLGLICMIAASAVAIYGQLYAYFTTVKEESNAIIPISSTVRSFILWHISVILTYQKEQLFVAILFYLLFEIAFYLRPDKKQI